MGRLAQSVGTGGEAANHNLEGYFYPFVRFYCEIFVRESKWYATTLGRVFIVMTGFVREEMRSWFIVIVIYSTYLHIYIY